MENDIGILNHIIGLLVTIFTGWFAWETTLAVDEMKRNRRRSNESSR